MLQPITYKQVLDSEGFLTHIELCQGDQQIRINLAGEGSHKNPSRWAEVRRVVDGLERRAKSDVVDNLSSDSNLSAGRVMEEWVKTTKEETK